LSKVFKGERIFLIYCGLKKKQRGIKKRERERKQVLSEFLKPQRQILRGKTKWFVARLCDVVSPRVMKNSVSIQCSCLSLILSLFFPTFLLFIVIFSIGFNFVFLLVHVFIISPLNINVLFVILMFCLDLKNKFELR